MMPFPPIVILNGGKNALWEKRETERWNGVKNLLCWWRLTAFPHYGNRSFTFASDDALLSVITQNGGRKRIFILFFCIIPPSQYPLSGFAGHLLINKEACPIPILPVRIPFLNTVANPLLALWMTPYRLRSFWTEARTPYEKNRKRDGDTEWRIYYADDILPLFLITVIDPSLPLRMTSYGLPHCGNKSFTFAWDDVLLFPSLRQQIQILHQCTGWRLADPRHSERG